MRAPAVALRRRIMAIHDFNAQRLFLDADLAAGAAVVATREQSNYLVNVLRLGEGAEILVFNGRDGEWVARIASTGKRATTLHIDRQVRAQTVAQPLIYLFAPLKRARLDYMVQKAVEMGVGRLAPVLTRRTVAERVNLERMRSNAIEAAEQCGILSIPDIDVPVSLMDAIGRWPVERPLIFCDESAPAGGPLTTLRQIVEVGDRHASAGLGVLIGPEGGFDPVERELLASRPFVTAISLGPRIMRADTAAVAALALVNAVLGDWR